MQLLIPILGSEIGRLEFTPDYVLIVDRLHQEYVKADYTQIDFLRDNGINFYSLQALFWNQLLIPGQEKVGYTQLETFDVDLDAAAATAALTLKKDKMQYQWHAERASGLLQDATVTYQSHQHGQSSLRWDYADFRAFASKMFPYRHTMTVSTSATGQQKELKATFEMNQISTSADWEARTELSGKYKQVSVEEVLGKLMSH